MPVIANEMSIREDVIKLNPIISSINIIWYVDVDSCSLRRHTMSAITVICAAIYEYLVTTDKREVVFFILNVILVDIIKRKAWIVNDIIVITEYIIII